MGSPSIVGIQKRCGNGKQCKHDMESIRDHSLLPIDEAHAKAHRHGERRYNRHEDIVPPHEHRRHPQCTVRQFDHGIARRNARPTGSAPPAQEEIGQDRDVFEPPQSAIATRAVRRRHGKAHLSRQTIDHHVEKTSDAYPDQSRQKRRDRKHIGIVQGDPHCLQHFAPPKEKHPTP